MPSYEYIFMFIYITCHYPVVFYINYVYKYTSYLTFIFTKTNSAKVKKIIYMLQLHRNAYSIQFKYIQLSFILNTKSNKGDNLFNKSHFRNHLIYLLLD